MTARPIGMGRKDQAMLNSVWLVPLCPLLGAILNCFFGRRYSQATVGQLAIAAVGASFLVSVAALVAFLSGSAASYQVPLFTWIASGPYSANVSFLLDGLSLTMMLVVTGVGLLIHIYSTGYMHDAADAGKKAFIVNRIGDFGFLLAILLLFVTFQSTDMLRIQAHLEQAQMGQGVLTTT